MADTPSSEESALWQRRLAAQANNRAWRLSESSNRSSLEDEEMLQAAHASMYFWKLVGNAANRAHAAQLVAHVYALLKLPNPAKYYLAQSEPGKEHAPSRSRPVSRRQQASRRCTQTAIARLSVR